MIYTGALKIIPKNKKEGQLECILLSKLVFTATKVLRLKTTKEASDFRIKMKTTPKKLHALLVFSAAQKQKQILWKEGEESENFDKVFE